jgi:hypothetical protein
VREEAAQKGRQERRTRGDGGSGRTEALGTMGIEVGGRDQLTTMGSGFWPSGGGRRGGLLGLLASGVGPVGWAINICLNTMANPHVLAGTRVCGYGFGTPIPVPTRPDGSRFLPVSSPVGYFFYQTLSV